jgi:hypothetical protein
MKVFEMFMECLWGSRSRRIRRDEEEKERKKYVVFFLVGDSLASEFYALMFWNTLSVPSS